MAEPVRCAKRSGGWQCKKFHVPVFVKGQWTKQCDDCRSNMRRSSKSETGNATRAKYVKTNAYAAKNKKACDKYRKSENGKSISKTRNAQPHYVEQRKVYAKGPRGKAARKKHDALPMSKLQLALGRMLRGTQLSSNKVYKKTEFKSNADMWDHLDSTMDKTWMNRENRGPHRKGDPPKTHWQLGHRIPIAAYDHDNEEDVLNCWRKINIFAQDAKENLEMSSSLPSTEVLLQLRSIWPQSWNGVLPS